MKTIKLPIRGIVYGLLLNVAQAVLVAWFVVAHIDGWIRWIAAAVAFMMAFDVLLAATIAKRSTK